MIVYNYKEILELQQIVDNLTGKGFDDDLGSILETFMGENPNDTQQAVRLAIREYLCQFDPIPVLSYKDYYDWGIENIIFESPREDLPLYTNHGENRKELLIKIVAVWRLMIGK